MKRLKFLLSYYSTHAVKEHERRRGIAPLIFNLGKRWMRVVKFKLLPLYPGKDYGTY